VSITRWDPWGDIVSLREAMNTLLEESFVRPRPGIAGPGMASSLALDVKETPDRYTVTASVPGVAPGDIEISVLGDTMRIRGHRKDDVEESGEGGRWLLRERRFGAFERTVSLPTAVNADQAQAAFHDGVLTITLPKAELATQKTIPVSSGTGAEAQGASPAAQRLSARYATSAPPEAVRGDGTSECPPDYPIKGNAESGIYHEPGASSYAQTNPEFCFASTSAAEEAGFTAAGS
jgi:HSP20 family protein